MAQAIAHEAASNDVRNVVDFGAGQVIANLLFLCNMRCSYVVAPRVS